MHGSAHTRQCFDCVEATQQEALSHRLMEQRSQQINQQSYAPSPFFMAKLTARLRTETESWEQAVPALRGWLLAFSATTILLMAAAFTLHMNSPAQPEEQVFTASANDSQPNDPFLLGD
jgi:hypothetical protein